MEINILEEDINYILSVKGDLDAHSALQLDQVLQQAINEKRRRILVDFKQLDYISSPGIGVFTSRIEDCEKEGIDIVLFGMNDKVSNVFQILGLDQLLPIALSKDEAKNLMNDLQKKN